MKEELTTKMHSEFTVSAEIEIKHNVFSVLSVVEYNNKDGLKKYADFYGVTLSDVNKYKDEFYRLRNQ
jgi:hypothetical protein